MNKISVFLFCLISILYVAAASMAQSPSDESDGNNNNNNNNNKNDNKKQSFFTTVDTDKSKNETPLNDQKGQKETNSEKETEEEEKEEEKEEEEDQSDQGNDGSENENEQEKEEEEEDDEDEEQEQEQEQEEEEEEEEIKMFGVSLEEIMKLQGDEDDEDRDKIPMILDFLMNRIKEMNGFQTEGIFRINGNIKDVELLANNGFDPYGDEINQYEVHTWASLLKKWIRELPEPLIPDNVHLQISEQLSQIESESTITTTDNDNDIEDPEKTQPILSNLLKSIQPPVFYDVLDSIFLFYAELLQPDNIEITKIGIDNLTTIITPTVFKTKLAISQENFSEILKGQSQDKQIIKLILNYYIQKYNYIKANEHSEEEKQQEQDVELHENTE
ncbi:RhoGAP domain-containing protein [Tieghemostelium lacteum]|uniref:RhoGAP domain-containing protein n=1 Tax=Tieghemostelium lacteum TaxID=361077 RepID=A0A151ZAR5_TIELA|nr:RhoGAP domain-containing protein [Tieghemostelium lacteum]|eukprot:KYQ91037.1 RhoGAP domain-containing protein [Tieghemostelium lacteum]